MLGMRYVARPDADGAKPLSEVEFVVVDLVVQKIVNRCVTQREATIICNYLNQQGDSDGSQAIRSTAE